MVFWKERTISKVVRITLKNGVYQKLWVVVFVVFWILVGCSVFWTWCAIIQPMGMV